MLIFFYFVLVMIPCATPLSFNLLNIGTKDQGSINLRGNNSSDISTEGIQLTSNEVGTAGQAIYIEPLHLWDNSSGKLADFSTNFTFIIDSNERQEYGDGLTFFLAPNNSVTITGGDCLGLPMNFTSQTAIDPFVAVEFDTFWNEGTDPENSTSAIGDHVGIDVSSMKSVRFLKWSSNVIHGKENEVWINYESTNKDLTVVFTGFEDNIKQQHSFSFIIDLRDELPEWVMFGFSASTGQYIQKNNIKSWGFHSSDFAADEENITMVPSETSTMVDKPKQATKKGLVVGLVGLVVSVGGLASVLLGISIWIKKGRGRKKGEKGPKVDIDDEFEKGSGPKRFSYKELACATNDFATEEKLGEGGFGGVYRGFLKEPNSYVAVKRVSSTSKQGMKEYAAEVKIISRLRHRNLVLLKGWCHENEELLLVYEFMENGSLYSHLFKEKSLLTWSVRFKVARGLASALLYLHEECEQCILHRDIKSSNVMLDSSFNAKLGDFGLAKLVDHEKGSHTTALAGTMGYVAPECVLTGKASKGSDIYSFGIVALEIACGQKPIDNMAEDCNRTLVDRVWENYGSGDVVNAADPKLGGDFQGEEMERLMIVGLWCAHPDPNFRPSVKQVIQVLNFESPLPGLPLTMPTLAFLPSTADSWLPLLPVFTDSDAGHCWLSSSDNHSNFRE